MVDRPKFLSELGTSILAGVVAIFSHMTLKNVSDIANVIIVIGMALTTTYAAVSGTVKFIALVKTWLGDKEPPAPPAGGDAA